MLGPLEQTADVTAVRPEDDDRDEHAGDLVRHRLGEQDGQQRHESGSHQGGEADVARREDHRDPHEQADQEDHRNERQDDAGAGGDALPTRAPEEDRVHVADLGRGGDEDRRPGVEQLDRDQRGDEALEDIGDHDRHPGPLAEDAEDIGGADIAGAVLPHVDPVEDLPDDDAEGDGADEIGEDQQDREARALQDVHFLPLKSMTRGTPSSPKCSRSRFSTK